ncbi:MAG: caspase family protein [Deltaproteobacteria bacterium]|nr:caspase family protein [Deltaproteobacteria bacterium]
MKPAALIPGVMSVLVAGGALAAERAAILSANNVGLSREAPLRYTTSDAERLASVLVELGNFDRDRVSVLRDEPASKLLAAIRALQGRELSLFVFYYSGHADPASLHMSRTSLPMAELLAAVDELRAKTKILIVDACQSAGILRSKGSRDVAPFLVRADHDETRGQIIIASSASSEQSFESASSGGSVFSMHLTAALRGAADSNEDLRVTLTEAYEYAYAQTVRATLLAGAGPQHPEFLWAIEGRRDLVITELARESMLTLKADEPSTFVLFDAAERHVLAELSLGESNLEQSIALPAGRYVVRQRTADALRMGRIELTRGDRRILFAHQMKRVGPIRLAVKGAGRVPFVRAAAGQLMTGHGPMGIGRAKVAVEWEGARWLVGAGLDGGVGSYSGNGLTTNTWYVAAWGDLLYSLHFDSVHVRAGPVLGLPMIATDLPADETFTLAAAFGATGRVDVDLTSSLSLVLEVTGQLLATRLQSGGDVTGWTSGPWALIPWASYALGMRMAL